MLVSCMVGVVVLYVCVGVFYGGCWCLVWWVMVLVFCVLSIGVLYAGCWCPVKVGVCLDLISVAVASGCFQ